VTAIRSSGGAARVIVTMILRGQVTGLMDVKLGLEYRDVALRPEHLSASELSQQEVLGLIESLEAASETVEIVIQFRPLSSDPNDDMILDLAINGHAEAVITKNAKHFGAAGGRFGIPILSPAEFLRQERRHKNDGD
jgi:predicted nucleic acid-binding protein